MNGIPKALKLIVAIILLALLMACSKDEDPTSVLQKSEINIDGDWKTGCMTFPDNDTRIIASFNFSKDTFTYAEHQYSDNACTQLNKTKTFPGKITYQGTESRKTPSGKTAYEKDLRFDDGEVWKILAALEDNDNTLYISPDMNGNARPDDITSRNSLKLSKGTVPPPKHVDINGTWKTDCIYLEGDKLGYGFIFKVSGNSFSLRTSSYSDNSCTQSKGSSSTSGKITYGKKVITPSGLTAHEIDLQTEDGDVFKSLVARQGNTLHLSTSPKDTDRPDDVIKGIRFSKQP
jgi:major membrane immunogen (membrane-anchored lipoprotein)